MFGSVPIGCKVLHLESIVYHSQIMPHPEELYFLYKELRSAHIRVKEQKAAAV